MIVLEEAHNIAVTIGKGENLRVTASRMFAALVEYVKTPDNDGAQQIIDAGFDPTDAGIWKMVISDPSWPKSVGISFSTGKKLLGIGRASSPETADQAERDREAVRVTQSTGPKANCNRDLEEWEEPPHEIDKVAALMTRVKDLTTDELRTFINKLGAYARALGLVK